MERHWNLVTQKLSAGVVADIAALIDVYRGYPQDAEQQRDPRRSRRTSSASLSISCPRPTCRRRARSRSSRCSTRRCRRNCASRSRRPFWIDTVGKSALVEIRIQLDNTVMRIFAPRSAAYASNSRHFPALDGRHVAGAARRSRSCSCATRSGRSCGSPTRPKPSARAATCRITGRAARARCGARRIAFIEMKTTHRARDRAAHHHARTASRTTCARS